MNITIGLIGFGKTGSVVANEIIKDEECTLKWVLRKSTEYEGGYASKYLGFEREEGKVYSISNIDQNTFFKDNKVDVIIDFPLPTPWMNTQALWNMARASSLRFQTTKGRTSNS